MKALRIPELEGRRVIAAGRLVANSVGQPVYIEAYDPDADQGRGLLRITGDPAKARRFRSEEEAMDYWLRCSTREPVRDGQPNRPLARELTAVAVDLP